MPIGATAAVVGSSIVGGVVQSNAANKAAKAQAAGDQAAIGEQARQFDTTVNLLEPSAKAGTNAKARQMLMLGYTPQEVKQYLNDTYSSFSNLGYGANGGTAPTTTTPTSGGSGGILGQILYGNGGGSTTTTPTTPATPSAPGATPDFSWVDSYDPVSYLQSTPGYQFGVNEGSKALQKSAAAKGALFSGATGKALTKFGNDYGSGYWDRLFNQQGELAGDGTSATGQVINVGQNTANNTSSLLQDQGRSRASGYLASGNAWANSLNRIGGYAGWNWG